MTRDHLADLESESIYVLREAFNKFSELAMLWSIGKDSTVLLWLARKAFLGHVPFPDRPYRHDLQDPVDDRVSRCLWSAIGSFGLLLPATMRRWPPGMTFPAGRATRVECCSALKKDALQSPHRTGQVHGDHCRRSPRRGTDPGQGAVLLAAQPADGVDPGATAAGILEPVQD